MQYHILYLYLRGRSVKLPSAEAVLSSPQCAYYFLSYDKLKYANIFYTCRPSVVAVLQYMIKQLVLFNACLFHACQTASLCTITTTLSFLCTHSHA